VGSRWREWTMQSLGIRNPRDRHRIGGDFSAYQAAEHSSIEVTCVIIVR
jgi:hypothetical protein